MQDARYFREHAELCLEMARQVSDRRSAESLRSDARHYFERADELDSHDDAAASRRRAPKEDH